MARRSASAVLAVLGLVALLVALAGLTVDGAHAVDPAVAATGATEPTEPTDPPEPTEAGTEVTDAVLRWGLTNESNTAAFKPGTYNLFSAGRVADPGRGNWAIRQEDWRARAGAVAVEKYDAASRRWKRATWAGTRTDSHGKPLRPSRTFSNHQVVFTGGTGTVDIAAGIARLAWQGDVTVLYYSGLSFFYLSDPVLEVAGGRGTLTATVSGFASSRSDSGSWAPVPARSVTVAVLPDVHLAADGFTAEPAYRGVRVDLEEGVQVTTGAGWGAFPQPFVSFMEQLGIGAFWYSSGGSADPNKVPLPVTVGLIDDAAPTPTPTAPSEEPTVDNTAPPPPEEPTSDAPGAVPDPGAAAPVAPAGAATPVGPAAADAGPLVPLARPTTLTPTVATLAPAAAPTAVGAATWPWWAGGGLLLAAAAALVAVPRRS